MPKIIASAIKVCPKDSEYPLIVCGKRHCNCFEIIWNSKIEYDKSTCEQGFLTNQNQFVDRREAMHIAWDYGQIDDKIYQPGKELFSEDLW